MTLKVDVSVQKVTNSSYREELIADVISDAKIKFADGANIDIEQIVDKGSAEEKGLTDFCKEMTDAFHAEIPGSQVGKFLVRINNKSIINKKEYKIYIIFFWSKINKIRLNSSYLVSIMLSDIEVRLVTRLLCILPI